MEEGREGRQPFRLTREERRLARAAEGNLLILAGGQDPTLIARVPRRDLYEPLARRIARKFGADEAVICAQVEHESAWVANAIGDSGHSVGLMQLHDQGMGRGMGDQRYDPEFNLTVAVKAHVHHRDTFGSVEAALTAHNAGGPAVGRAYGEGGTWEDVVHHKKNGHVVYVRDIYVLPILATAARKYR